MNPEVTDYIAQSQPWQQEACDTLRQTVHKTIADIEERLQYGKPHFIKNGEFLAVIHIGKDKVSFMLFNAKNIEEIKGVLRSMGGGERKVIDITEGQEIDYDMIAGLLSKVAATI